MEAGLAPRLAAYAAWNTAGNTLGITLTPAVARMAHFRRSGDREGLWAHIAHLFLRFLNDYGYQAIVRTETMFVDLPILGIEPTMTELPQDVEAVQARGGLSGKASRKASEPLPRRLVTGGAFPDHQ